MPKSNRLAGEDFQDFQKEKTSRHRRWSVVPSMRRQLAATRRDPETASGRHYQGPIISQDSPNPGGPGGWAACTAALSSPPVLLTTSNNGRSGAAKQPAQPKKTYPSSQSPPAQQLPSSAPGQKCKTGTHMEKGGVTYRILVTEEKKGGVDRVCCCCESRSVGRSRMAGRFRRTNERCGHPAVVLGGGGEVTQGPLVWV